MRKSQVNSIILGMLIAATSTASLAPSYAAAQNAIAVTRGGATGSFLGEKGDYKVETYDRGALETIFSKHFRDRQDQDRVFIEEAVRKVEIQLKGLVDELNKPGGLVTKANESVSGKQMELTEYLGAQQQVVAAVNSANTALGGLFLIPSAVKSQEGVKIDANVKVELPASLKVDLEQIKNFFQTQLDQNLSQVKSLIFFVKMPNGVPQQISGIDFRPDQVIIDASKIEEMSRGALALRQKVNNVELRALVNELNKQTVEEIRAIRDSFGTAQIYRWQLNEEGKELNFARLSKIFVARDFLRYSYGVQLGAIAINYQPMMANLDVIFTGNKTLLSNILPEFFTRAADLTKFQNFLANAKATADKRDKEIFGKGVAILDRIMSGITWVSGQSQLAEINALAITLLARDVKHELMLTEVGGSKMVRESFRTTYAKSPEVEAATREVVGKFAAIINKEDKTDDLDADIGGVQAGTFSGAFRVAVTGLDSMINYIEQARQQEAGIEALRALCKTCGTVKKRTTF